MAILTTPAGTGGESARAAVERRLRRGRFDLAGLALQVALVVALALTVGILAVLLIDMLRTGSSVLTERLVDFLSGALRSQAASSGVLQGLVGTFWIGVFVVVLSFPVGIAAAVYLEEYAKEGRLRRLIDVNVRNLAGVPSVVYGLLGLTIFVNALRGLTGPGANGRSLVSAGLTLAILVLPIVIITSAEAVRAVPSTIREAGYGIGATRWEVVGHHVLPYAAPGILTGTILSLARAMGEAAPLILVGATSEYLTGGDRLLDLGALRERFTAMPTVITTWAQRPGADWEQVTAAAIVILLAVVLLANAAAILLRNKFEKRRA